MANPSEQNPPVSSAKEIFRVIHNIWLHYRFLYNQFAGLYRQENRPLVDQCAGAFFGAIEEMFWEYTCITIAKLTDPATQGSKSNPKENLTLLRLGEQLARENLLQEAALIDKCLTETRCCWQPIRDWRNAAVAHVDLPTHLHGTPPPGLPDNCMKTVVDEFSKLLEALYLRLMEGGLSYDNIVAIGEWQALVNHLRRAVRLFENFDSLQTADIPQEKRDLIKAIRFLYPIQSSNNSSHIPRSP